MRGSGLLAASPRFHGAPGPRALRLREAPSAPCRPRASKCARPHSRATLRAPCGLAVISVWQNRVFFAPQASLPRDPRRSMGPVVISVPHFRAIFAPCAWPLALGRPRSDATPCVLKHSGGLVSWRFLACSRRNARLLKKSSRVEQSPPTRAAAPATSGHTGGRELYGNSVDSF